MVSQFCNRLSKRFNGLLKLYLHPSSPSAPLLKRGRARGVVVVASSLQDRGNFVVGIDLYDVAYLNVIKLFNADTALVPTLYLFDIVLKASE